MSGDRLDLDAIEAKARRLAIVARNLSQRELFEDDVPALVAEVRRLRALLDDAEVRTIACTHVPNTCKIPR